MDFSASMSLISTHSAPGSDSHKTEAPSQSKAGEYLLLALLGHQQYHTATELAECTVQTTGTSNFQLHPHLNQKIKCLRC